MAADPAIPRKRLPVLVLRKGGEVVQTLPLTRARITIGRRTFNDLVIDSPNVSAEHAVVLNMLDAFCYEDLGSTNGSCINGEKVTRHFLDEGDVIEFGAHAVEFCMEESAEELAIPIMPLPDAKHHIDLVEPLPEVPALYEPILIDDATKTDLASEESDNLLYPPPPLPHLPRSAQATAVIRILNGPRAGTETILNKSLTTMGYPDRQVAVLTPSGESWVISPLSSEPPSINGVPLTLANHQLLHGDTIFMGGVECLFYLDWWYSARTH